MKKLTKLFTVAALLSMAVLAITLRNATDEASNTVVASIQEPQTVIIGSGDPNGPCSVEIHTSTLPEMIEVGIYKWVIACEADLAKQTQ